MSTSEKVEEGEGERENPKQALHCQPRARCGAQSYEPQDHDLSQNQESDAQPTEASRCPRGTVFSVGARQLQKRGRGGVVVFHQPVRVCFPSSLSPGTVGKLLGPLPMHPAAEDNYGYDACAILCLPCVPNILVIATESGMLYHCVVLEGEEEDEQTVSQARVCVRVSGAACGSRAGENAQDARIFLYV